MASVKRPAKLKVKTATLVKQSKTMHRLRVNKRELPRLRFFCCCNDIVCVFILCSPSSMRSMLEEFAVFNKLSDIIVVEEDVGSLLGAFRDVAVASFFIVVVLDGFSGFSSLLKLLVKNLSTSYDADSVFIVPFGPTNLCKHSFANICARAGTGSPALPVAICNIARSSSTTFAARKAEWCAGWDDKPDNARHASTSAAED